MSLDPRSTSLPSTAQLPRRRHSHFLLSSRHSYLQSSYRNVQKPPCCDWIFSSATNVHIAVDKSSFKTFNPLDSYVLTVSDSRPITVRGIGSVELKIRCKPLSHQSRVIVLEDVLYVPGWYCNIVSDIYFCPNFEHRWSDCRLQFTKMDGKSRPWGYTEPFCGLDRLVLSKKQIGRSPMLEDKDREIWSINLNWPQSQRNKWEDLKSQEQVRMTKEHESEILAQQRISKKHTESTELLLPMNQDKSPNPKLKTGSPVSPSKVSIRSERGIHLVSHAKSFSLGERVTLNEISSNVPMKSELSERIGSLKASLNTSRGLLKDLLPTATRG